jgi:hypothetical protein
MGVLSFSLTFSCGCPHSFFLLIPRKEKARASNAGLFHFSGFCRGRESGLGLEWLPADCATHCLPQALCICTSVTRCEYILVSSAPTSMLATVTDAHMPGDLVQSAGKVFWLSSLFLMGVLTFLFLGKRVMGVLTFDYWRRSLMRICWAIWCDLRVKCYGCLHSFL